MGSTNITHRIRHTSSAVVATAILTGLVAGCGSSASTTAPPSGSMDQVQAGVIPILDVAPIYLGKQKGFFKAQGIDLHLTRLGSGSDIVAAVQSGQTQFGFSSTVPFMIAVSKGLPLTAVAPGLASTGEPGKDIGAIAVAKGSKINTVSQLAGKTFATNSVSGLCSVAVNATMRNDAPHSAKPKYVEVEVPDTINALNNRTVKAACMVEPFLSQWKASGGKTIASQYIDLAPGTNALISLYFTSDKLKQKKPNLVKRFTIAIRKSLEYAESHPEDVRAVVPTYTKIPASQMNKVVLPEFPSKFGAPEVRSLQKIAKNVKADGLVPNTFDARGILP